MLLQRLDRLPIKLIGRRLLSGQVAIKFCADCGLALRLLEKTKQIVLSWILNKTRNKLTYCGGICNGPLQFFFSRATFSCLNLCPWRAPMLQCELHQFLAHRRQSLHDFALETGLNYNTLYRLYHQTATRVDLETIAIICRHLGCGVGDLFTVLDQKEKPKLPASARLKRGRHGGIEQ